MRTIVSHQVAHKALLVRQIERSGLNVDEDDAIDIDDSDESLSGYPSAGFRVNKTSSRVSH